METLLQDFRHGFRLLRKTPGLTAVAILTLTLGIGANTAIFSVFNAVLLRPLPYDNPSRLVWLSNYLPHLKDSIVATPDFLAWRNQAHSFSDLAAYNEGELNLTGVGDPERIHAAYTSASLFSVLGVQPELGRGLRKEENTPESSPVAILSHGFWKKRFAGDRSVIGKRITLDGAVFEVIGVMPARFIFPTDGASPDVLAPLSLPEHLDLTSQAVAIVHVIARVAPGITLSQAKAELSTIDERLIAGYPPAFKNMAEGTEAQVVGLQEKLAGDTRPVLMVLQGAVVFLLLIACVNTANLQLAKATARGKELAVRAALGAGKYRLSRQLLSESVLVALLGGGAGILLAVQSIDVLNRLHPPGLPQFVHVHLDYRVLGFTALVAILTGILSGLAPAIVACRADVNDTLKEGAQTHTESRGLRLVRKFLVVSEVALAAILLVGSGLFIRSFVGLLYLDPGFDPHQLLTLQIALPEAKYSGPAQQGALFENLVQRLSSLPGVTHASAASELPRADYTLSGSVIFEGRVTPLRGLRPMVPVCSATSDYFRTMAVPLIAGRSFDPTDTPNSPGVVLVNQAFTRRFFSGENPIGKRVQLGGQNTWLTIVGIIGDMRHLGVQTGPSPELFTSFQQDPRAQMFVALRTAMNPAALTSAVRDAVLTLDKEQPIFDVATMEGRLAESLAAQRWNTWLLAAFAGTALALAAAGIYGVISYFVVQRTHEIGVRMALGATPESVLAIVLRQGAAMVILGGIIGLAASLVLTRFIAGMIYGVRISDPATYLGAGALLAVVAWLASYIPARRAARVDPMVALRYE